MLITMPELPKQPCVVCGGTGIEIDHTAVGNKFKALRLDYGISQRLIAKRMGFSAAYLADLEHGTRKWSPRLIEMYEHALAKGA